MSTKGNTNKKKPNEHSTGEYVAVIIGYGAIIAFIALVVWVYMQMGGK